MQTAILLIPLLWAATNAGAQTVKNDWTLEKSTLTYHVHYPLKNAEGVSHAAKGKGRCAAGACEFLIAVPTKSFESGDGNRDNHMLEVTKAGLHPMVVVKVKIPATATATATAAASPGTVKASVAIEFAGESHTYEQVEISTKSSEAGTSVTGRIPLVLSDFKVERPSLLAVKIDDQVPLDFELTWR